MRIVAIFPIKPCMTNFFVYTKFYIGKKTFSKIYTQKSESTPEKSTPYIHLDAVKIIKGCRFYKRYTQYIEMI